jgi:membrane-associated phospholipid phosphatase
MSACIAGDISTVLDFLTGVDVSTFRALNNFAGWSPTLDRLAVHIGDTKSMVFMGFVGAFWYWNDKEMPRRRQTVLAIILAVAVSLILNRTISVLLPFRVRPMYSLGANGPASWEVDLEHWSSFPSDYATYLFAIAAGFSLMSIWSGVFFGIFAALISLARVYLGLHYPSDVVVGALLGVATSVAINREAIRQQIAKYVLALEPRYPPHFYSLLFITLAEVSAAFPNTRHIAAAIVHLFIGYKQ